MAVADVTGRQAKAPAVVMIGTDGAPIGGPSGVAPVSGQLTQGAPTGAPFAASAGRSVRLTVSGVFGGATVGWQRSYDDGATWSTQTAGGSSYPAFTAAADEVVDQTDEGGVLMRAAVLSGASGTTAIAYRIGHA